MFWFKKKPKKSLKDIDFDKEDTHAIPTNSTEEVPTEIPEDTPELVEIFTNSIAIDLGDRTFSWTFSPYYPKDDLDIGSVWKDFLEWYDTSTDSSYYIMRTADSQRMLLRKDIRTFNIEVTSKKTIKENNDV